MNKFRDILNYWYELELLSPYNLRCDKKDCLINPRELPWESAKSDVSDNVFYDIYVGRVSSQKLIDKLLEREGLAKEEIRNDATKSCIFALQVNHTGIYIEDSFQLSGFAWAMNELITNGIGCELNIDVFQNIQNELKSKLRDEESESAIVIERTIINEFYAEICDKYLSKIVENDSEINLVIKKKLKLLKNDANDSANKTELLESFYLKEIKKVEKNPTDTVENFVKSLCEVKTGRIEIDKDIDEMQKWTSIEKYPRGLWPSAYGISLMQQIGINLSISDEQKIFSVNGPPGSGKTTLLKEILVEQVVRRAEAMAGFDNLEDAFERKCFNCPPDKYNRYYYEPDSRLTGFGIIVASNNNSAVENITVELPKHIKKARTDRFTRESAASDRRDIYFSKIAQKLLQNEDAWGLISARLGRKQNIVELENALRDDNFLSKNDYLDFLSWEEARNNFYVALKAVNKERENIKETQKICVQLRGYEKAIKEETSKKSDLEEKAKYYENECAEAEKSLKRLSIIKETCLRNFALQKKRISLFKRIFKRFFQRDLSVIELNKSFEEVKTVQSKYVAKSELLQKCQNYLSDCKVKILYSEDKIAELIKASDKIRKEKDARIAKHANAYDFSSDEFWRDIDKNVFTQETAPWVNEDYDKLREELFYHALQVHKAFILHSHGAKQNIKRYFAMCNNHFTYTDKKEAYSSLINTLMFLVPVISTTFASVASFLEYAEPESIGMLIIDEAGQATPQSALGAIWRARKTIIVGDPMQLEPILSVPKELQYKIADKYNISNEYRGDGVSVQNLADAMNKYGANRTYQGSEKLWIGCPLVLHRRCIEPMFTISNEIAYNNKMILKTAQSEENIKFLMEKSCWIDVKGEMECTGDQNVKEQNDIVLKMVSNSLLNSAKFPDIYIITPFNKITDRLISKLIKYMNEKNLNPELKDDLKTHCGTVHTFQGKEANEVILVLGCDKLKGAGAMRWVGEKPNLINVAVTRAKFRLYVIGDYEIWKDVPNVREMRKYLPVVKAEELTFN